LISRGHTAEIDVVEARLDQSRSALEGLTGEDLDRAYAEQEVVWRTRLGDLLEQDLSVEAELRDLIAETQSKVQKAAGGVEQHVAAFDQAQQAVLGQGVQNVRFGDRH
jgi:predicted outer membrane protein